VVDICELIDDLGRVCGTPLNMPLGRTLSVRIDNGAPAHLEHDPVHDVLYVYTHLGEEPQDDAARGRLYRRLLLLNLFGHETAGARIAIDGSNGEILLTHRLETSRLTGDSLHAALQAMAASAEHVRAVVGNAAEAPQGDKGAAAPALSIFGGGRFA
jgi:hypothetical protein